jgi:hypothetical protein
VHELAAGVEALEGDDEGRGEVEEGGGADGGTRNVPAWSTSEKKKEKKSETKIKKSRDFLVVWYE